MPFLTEPALNSCSHAQRERLAFIDFCLQFYGSAGRGELMDRFGTAVASGTRDFALYRELAPNNLEMRHESKRYYRTDGFQPLFHHDSRAVLHALAHGVGDGVIAEQSNAGFCEDAPNLITPPMNILAPLSRAISQGQAVQMTYLSLSSGESKRVMVPHSLVNNGHRWHVRGYCRQRNEFRDFVCTRITGIHSASSAVVPEEQQAADMEWNRFLRLELVPHPGHDHPEAIAHDFNMYQPASTQPVRELSVRAARAGYLLRYWYVDCSPEHRLPAHEYHLWLRNHDILTDCTSAVLAPGHKK